MVQHKLELVCGDCFVGFVRIHNCPGVPSAPPQALCCRPLPGLAWLPPLAAYDTIHSLEFLSKAHSDFTLLSFAMAVKRIDMPQRWISLLIIAVTISILAPVST